MSWRKPRDAPSNGTKVRVWIDECDGFEHPEDHYVCRKYSDGRPGFRKVLGDRHTAISLWRLPDDIEPPTAELVAQSHKEADEDDSEGDS